MQGLIAAGLGLALLGCGEEDLFSDLNTEGAPRVITVTVLDDTLWNAEDSRGNSLFDIMDAATWCADAAVEKTNADFCPEEGEELLAEGAQCFYPRQAGDLRCETGLVCAPESFLPNGVAQGVCAPVVALPGYLAPNPDPTDIPDGWEAKLVFNERLDTSVERVLPCLDGDHDGMCSSEETAANTDGLTYGSLIATQPVTITCGGESIAYDGYYQPAGNQFTIPPGPSLVLRPLEFAATGSMCEILIDESVASKEGEGFEDRGPFTFRIGPMQAVDTDPANGGEIAATEAVSVSFNVPVSDTGLSSAIAVDDGTADVPIVVVANGNDAVISHQSGAWTPGTTYTVTVGTGVQDIEGGPYVPPSGGFQFTFSTVAP